MASTAKGCTLSRGKDETPPTYTPDQAARLINLLNETKVLRHVMKVPQDIRSNPDFESHYSVVVKCLAPTRGKRKAMSRRGTTSDLLESTPAPSSVPPPKPKRLFRHRRSTVGAHSRGESADDLKVCVYDNGDQYLISEYIISCSLTAES